VVGKKKKNYLFTIIIFFVCVYLGWRQTIRTMSPSSSLGWTSRHDPSAPVEPSLACVAGKGKEEITNDWHRVKRERARTEIARVSSGLDGMKSTVVAKIATAAEREALQNASS